MEASATGMDETTREIIERITVTYAQPTKIRSGHLCSVYYDCIQLTPSDLARLAAQALGHLTEHAFDIVVGMANYGIFFASALAGGKHVGILTEAGAYIGPNLSGRRVVVADDVVYSGKGLQRARQNLEQLGAKVVAFACIVDRSDGQANLDLPLWSSYQTNMI